MEIHKYSSLAIDCLKAAKELPKQSVFSYVNKNSLGEKYFKLAKKYVKTPYIYIILSATGSPFGNMIAVATGEEYNHASFSFDENLETLIAYNGGNGISNPGLNHEKIEYFHQKPDAKIAVYKMKADIKQKKKMLEEIKKIDEEGSSYNIARIVMKKSFAPNIKVCAQFVYELLESVNLNYFKANPQDVLPIDFVKKNKDNILEFCYEEFLKNLI